MGTISTDVLTVHSSRQTQKTSHPELESTHLPSVATIPLWQFYRHDETGLRMGMGLSEDRGAGVWMTENNQRQCNGK